MEIQNINIIILDDDSYYRMALEKQLHNTICALPVENIYSFVFFLYDNPLDFIFDCKTQKFNKNQNIAFIDYFLGKGIHGDYVLNFIKSHDINIKPILISQSKIDREKLTTDHQLLRDIDFIEKNMYSFTMCSIYFEEFLHDSLNLTHL